ncbi:interleukin-17C-like [Thalassophryne amazonica]|uniref:interleukin-17C-like n=1 Tax=Thalassophryne amazonica TaxID=390379 RepID=UPI001470C10F|nr:interleukin-17C-like [Thalassophryne amazonica]
MSRVSVQTVSVQVYVVLLLLVLKSAAGSRPCVSAHAADRRATRLLRYWDKLRALTVHRNHSSTCVQTGAQLHSERSLSPWRYSIDVDVNRIPCEIAVANCICQGCIINQREDLSYNSVPVVVPLMVFRKAVCPTDPQRYRISREVITVAVACTCVTPRSNK